MTEDEIREIRERAEASDCLVDGMDVLKLLDALEESNRKLAIATEALEEILKPSKMSEKSDPWFYRQSVARLALEELERK